MKNVILTILFYFSLHLSFGQMSNFQISKIDIIVRNIDSTCISGGIEDFLIYKKGHKKKKLGGGADWYYTDSSGKKLVKVIREILLESETFETYYFYQDSLIFFKTTNITNVDNVRNSNLARECYFNNQELILKQNNLTVTFNPKIILDTAKSFFIEGKIWKEQFK